MQEVWAVAVVVGTLFCVFVLGFCWGWAIRPTVGQNEENRR